MKTEKLKQKTPAVTQLIANKVAINNKGTFTFYKGCTYKRLGKSTNYNQTCIGLIPNYKRDRLSVYLNNLKIEKSMP